MGHDQSVLIRDPRLPYLLQFARRQSPTRRLWPGSPSSFRAALRLLLSQLGLGAIGFSAYSLRRGGASQAFASGVPFDQLLHRGRWQNIKTARLYLDSGRAALIQLRFSPSVHRFLHLFVTKVTLFCEQLRRERQALSGISACLGWEVPIRVS